MKRFFITCILFFSLIYSAQAHDFNEDTLNFLISNPELSWSEFQDFAQNKSNDDLLVEKISTIDTKIQVVLGMPGKRYLRIYAHENPNFTYQEIYELMKDDALFMEIGPENIYSFLVGELAYKRDIVFSLDFFLRTIYIGFSHIILGIDHILFLFTLIVTLPRLKRILGIITTFTLAHCITLILGSLKIISLPSVLVESMILISIVVMGVLAIFKKIGTQSNVYKETIIIFLLGLFHGLGFAGFFSGILETSQNILFPVIGFNIGVELGQIMIMGLLLAFLYTLYYVFSGYKDRVKNILSMMCIVISLYWLVLMYI